MTRFLVWYWSGGGGGSQFAVNLATRLARQFGPEAVTLSLRADDPTQARALRDGVATRLAPIVSTRRQALTSLMSLPESARVLAEHAAGADVVIVPMNFAVAAPLSLTLKRPLVYCAHDPHPHAGDYAAQGQRLTQSLLLWRAQHVVALSDFAATQLRGVASKLHTAPLACVFAPRPAPPPPGEGPVRLLFCGRMIAYKGAALLADALERLGRSDAWRLTVAGDGPALTPELVARFRALGADVRSCWLAEAEIDSLMQDHDVVLAPYLEATQSGVVADALCHGRPCVVTPVGALREQVGAEQAGWCADAASAEGLAAAFERALGDAAARRRKGEAALAMAEAAYGADAWGWLATLPPP